MMMTWTQTGAGKTAWLKVIRAHFLGGSVQKVGTVYETNAKLALEMIATGKAERAEAPKPDTPKLPAKRKYSIKTEAAEEESDAND